MPWCYFSFSEHPLSVSHAFSEKDLITLEVSLKRKTDEVRGVKRPASPGAGAPASTTALSAAAIKPAADPKKPPEGYVFENHKLKKLKPAENRIIYVHKTGKDGKSIYCKSLSALQISPLARLRGGISKIAWMAPVVAPSWLYMHDYSSLPCSMWAVGGVWSKIGGASFSKLGESVLCIGHTLLAVLSLSFCAKAKCYGQTDRWKKHTDGQTKRQKTKDQRPKTKGCFSMTHSLVKTSLH